MASQLGQHSIPHGATRADRLTLGPMPAPEGRIPTGFRTYDVFDTVLTRMVGLPASVFRLVGQRIVNKGIWDGTSEQFMEARVLAETLARVHSPSGEVDLAAIYRQISFLYGLSNVDCSVIAGMELSTEEAILRAVPENLTRLESDRQRGMTVGFISDMYLPSPVIRRWLAGVGAYRTDDLIWVSCEHGLTKSRGDLFDLVAQQFPVARSAWRHFGDNVKADVESPRDKGIGAEHFSACHLSSAEQMMEAWGQQTCGLSSLIAGASRWTRLTLDGDGTPYQATLNCFAAEVAGPTLYGFALWVILESRKKQIRRLRFSASCGEVMAAIARAIADRLGIDLDIGILYVDRKILRIASLRAIDEGALTWILDGADGATLDGVLGRLGVRLDVNLAVRAADFGLTPSGSLGQTDLDSLKNFFLDPEASARVLSAASEHRAVLIDYFEQRGLVGQESCSLVDLAWTDSALKEIGVLIGPDSFEHHLCLCFGLLRPQTETGGPSMRGYLFGVEGSEACGLGAGLDCLSSLMETLCQSGEGSLRALVRRNGVFEPVYEARSGDVHAKSAVVFLQRRLTVFAQSVLVEHVAHKSVDLRPMVAALLERGLHRPTEPEARILGEIWISSAATGLTPGLVHRPYRWQDALSAFRTGAWPIPGSNWWPAGAVVLTPYLIRIVLKFAAKLGRFFGAGRGGRPRFA